MNRSEHYPLVMIGMQPSDFFNHRDLTIGYHKMGRRGTYRITSIRSDFLSFVNPVKDNCKLSNTTEWLHLNTSDLRPITYTYSVTWVPSEIRWATRWDSLTSYVLYPWIFTSQNLMASVQCLCARGAMEGNHSRLSHLEPRTTFSKQPYRSTYSAPNARLSASSGSRA